MTAGALPFLVCLAETGVVGWRLPAPGIFCLLDRRPEAPDCEFEVGELFDPPAEGAFRFLDETIEAAGFSASEGVIRFVWAAVEETVSGEWTVWLAA